VSSTYKIITSEPPILLLLFEEGTETVPEGEGGGEEEDYKDKELEKQLCLGSPFRRRGSK
jgi:hypothetical protein